MTKIINTILFLLILLPAVVFSQDVNFNNKLRLAQSYQRGGQPEKAIEKYKELLEIQPFNSGLVKSLNDLYVETKQYDQAIQLIEEALKKNPGNVAYGGMLGSTYYISGQEDKAYEIWDNTIKQNPGVVTTYRIIANEAIQQRAFEKASEILVAGKTNTDNPVMFQHDLAQIYTIQMNYEDAVKEYCEILQTDPKQIGVVKSRIFSFIESHGAFDKSVPIVEKYAEETGSEVFYDLLSGMYISLGKYEEAYNVIQQLNTDDRRFSNLMYSFGVNAMRDGAFNVAANAFDHFIENNPQSNMVSLARVNRAACLKGTVDIKLSGRKKWRRFYKPDSTGAYNYLPVIKAFEELVKIYSTQTTEYNSLFSMGQIYQDNFRNYKKADSLFSIVVNESPLSDLAGEAWIRRGEIALLQERYSEAETFFNNALNAKRAQPDIKDQAVFEIAKLKLRQQEFEQASENFAKLATNPAGDYANDAIRYNIIINTFKQDSLNLIRFAKAEDLTANYMFDSAAVVYREIAENDKLMLLNELAAVREAEMYVAAGDYEKAVKLLTEFTENENNSSYKDEALFLLAETYRNGLNNKEMATDLHEKLLEKFPRSLYLDKSREIINELNINKNKNI